MPVQNKSENLLNALRMIVTNTSATIRIQNVFIFKKNITEFKLYSLFDWKESKIPRPRYPWQLTNGNVPDLNADPKFISYKDNFSWKYVCECTHTHTYTYIYIYIYIHTKCERKV